MMTKLEDITPQKLRCPRRKPFCPGVFKTDHGTYILIGRRLTDEDHKNLSPQIQERIGKDEGAIEIGEEYLSALGARVVPET